MINANWRPVVATLAHNRAFTASEITEYTRFDQRRLDGKAVIREMRRLGYLQRVARGQYYPTSAGWRWIDNDPI
jgi:hypothetical protein